MIGPGSAANGEDRRLALAAVAANRSGDAGLVGELVSLCRAATSQLGVRGAVVNLMTSRDSDCVVASSDEAGRRIGELPFTLGEGPAFDAFDTARPVLVADLADRGGTSWPAYSEAAVGLGVGAVFAVPMMVGAVELGVLELYAARPRALDPDATSMIFAFAAVGTEMLLGGAVGTDGLDVHLGHALDHRAQVHQAQGMVMVDLGVDLAEALVRMRAHAFGHGVPLIEVARDVVAGLVLPAGFD